MECLKWVFDGIGTQMLGLIVGLIMGGLGGGAIGYKLAVKNKTKQKQKARDNANHAVNKLGEEAFKKLLTEYAEIKTNSKIVTAY